MLPSGILGSVVQDVSVDRVASAPGTGGRGLHSSAKGEPSVFENPPGSRSDLASLRRGPMALWPSTLGKRIRRRRRAGFVFPLNELRGVQGSACIPGSVPGPGADVAGSEGLPGSVLPRPFPRPPASAAPSQLPGCILFGEPVSLPLFFKWIVVST